MILAETILIRVTGRDQPGITTAVMSILAAAEAAVQDVEQIVIRGRLNLGILVDVPAGKDVLKEVLLLGWERGLDVDFEVVETDGTASIPSLVVSMIGTTLTPRDLESVTAAIAKAGGNIERIRRLAKTPVWCYEFEVHGGDADEMRTQLVDTAADNPSFDVAIQRTGLVRRAQRLVVLDVHTDTVTVEHMTDPPFDGRIEDGCVWGRGALDTKASLGVITALLASWKQAGVRPEPTLLVVGSIAEEAGGLLGAAHFRPWSDERGLAIDQLIVSEPTQLAPISHTSNSRATGP